MFRGNELFQDEVTLIAKLSCLLVGDRDLQISHGDIISEAADLDQPAIHDVIPFPVT